MTQHIARRRSCRGVNRASRNGFRRSATPAARPVGDEPGPGPDGDRRRLPARRAAAALTDHRTRTGIARVRRTNPAFRSWSPRSEDTSLSATPPGRYTSAAIATAVLRLISQGAFGLTPSTVTAVPILDTASTTKQQHLFSRRTNSLLGVRVAGCGSFVPEQVVTNADLQTRFGFDPEWIRQRTGILERRHAPPEMATSDMCIEAARRALRSANVDPQDIDLLVCGTFTPDFQCPSTACLIQDRLSLDCAAFDLAAACAGFMYAMVTAAQYVATGNARAALVVGGDCMSRIINPADQRTYPLFGDGAGAVVLTAGDPHQGLLCYQMGADGSGGPLLDRMAGGTRSPLTHAGLDAGDQFLRMDGRSVFKWAVRLVTDTIDLMLESSGLTVQDVSLFALHQANIRIIDAAMEQLGIPPEKVYSNVHRYGNTSGGSIPLVLDEALREGRIERGDTLLMCGFGAGLAWGTSLFRW
ncbi:MAG: ketoacyl-ACP synthase III [Planctomyces sp.]|nr:ketoacyl-ACP synthase III [Planctomyces sp.]